MNVKQVAHQQYKRLAGSAREHANLKTPPEGWLRTVRKALGMSGAQLAEKMNVTRARVAQAEHAELSGAATLKSMQAAAEALGCEFVYAIVPKAEIDDLIMEQARKKAYALVTAVSTHMALEKQQLSDGQIAKEIERVANEIVREKRPDFWKLP